MGRYGVQAYHQFLSKGGFRYTIEIPTYIIILSLHLSVRVCVCVCVCVCV